ncbi:MAG: hypothetical protein RLZZ618_2664 [Pseudomonadota bacterium]|jgi:hypothetical protein
MRQMFTIALFTIGVCTSALAQQPTPSPAKTAASAPLRETAPGPATRPTQDGPPAQSDQPGNVATPQVSIPLKRAKPDPVALKPGKREPARGGIDDSVARCQARAASGPRANCGKP